MRDLDGEGVTRPMLYCLFIGPNPSGRVNKTMQFIFFIHVPVNEALLGFSQRIPS